MSSELDARGFSSTVRHLAVTRDATVTSSSANALAVGPAGATAPAFAVDASAEHAATGVRVTAEAAGDGVHVAATSTGTNEALYIDAAGAGVIILGNESSGGVTVASGTLAAEGGANLSGGVTVDTLTVTAGVTGVTGGLTVDTLTVTAGAAVTGGTTTDTLHASTSVSTLALALQAGDGSGGTIAMPVGAATGGGATANVTVTINAPCGRWTSDGLSTAAGYNAYAVTINNSYVTASSRILTSISNFENVGGFGTTSSNLAGLPIVAMAQPGAGTITLVIANAGTHPFNGLTAVVVDFVVIGTAPT